MLELILVVYAAICVIATIAFIAFGFSSKRNAKSNVHQTIEEFEQAITDDRSDFNFPTPDLTTSARGLSEPFSGQVTSPFH